MEVVLDKNGELVGAVVEIRDGGVVVASGAHDGVQPVGVVAHILVL